MRSSTRRSHIACAPRCPSFVTHPQLTNEPADRVKTALIAGTFDLAQWVAISADDGTGERVSLMRRGRPRRRAAPRKPWAGVFTAEPAAWLDDDPLASSIRREVHGVGASSCRFSTSQRVSATLTPDHMLRKKLAAARLALVGNCEVRLAPSKSNEAGYSGDPIYRRYLDAVCAGMTSGKIETRRNRGHGKLIIELRADFSFYPEWRQRFDSLSHWASIEPAWRAGAPSPHHERRQDYMPGNRTPGRSGQLRHHVHYGISTHTVGIAAGHQTIPT